MNQVSSPKTQGHDPEGPESLRREFFQHSSQLHMSLLKSIHAFLLLPQRVDARKPRLLVTVRGFRLLGYIDSVAYHQRIALTTIANPTQKISHLLYGMSSLKPSSFVHEINILRLYLSVCFAIGHRVNGANKKAPAAANGPGLSPF
ncbi:hypothetical protein LGM46_34270 [Burkholderia arboris]|uniref:hypothetical protein n=1 Tax=Burkholderia arboris TaxID=488730 RepID=UPI001CF109F7|nr:hypothetical protein [Burkholderia arboris]MCA8038041.1 hypothetical protein [Burkholderia arboris]